jgi:tRNA(Ile)-lysidine synthase
MASSGKSSRSSRRRPDLAARVATGLARVVRPAERLVAGLSGGVDSVVLLDCLQRAARGLRVRLSALHVNHQLSPDAGRWEAFCRRLCRARRVSFRAVRVNVPRAGSLEAMAREARYAAFRAQPADYIVLAQHQDDQVETLLLQLLRGAGVKGLSGMPPLRKAEGRRAAGAEHHASFPVSPPAILRPLLDATREEIVEYAKSRGLTWVEDESNDDTRYQRNFLRREVLPVLARRFPQYRVTVARSVRHLAEAAGLLDALAAQDGAGALLGGALSLTALEHLPPPRARNLLRYFLSGRGVSMPGTERLEEALRQVLQAKRDARVRVALAGAELRRFGGRLYVVPARAPVPAGYERRWGGERTMVLPELGGRLELVPVRGEGISMARLRAHAVTLQVRTGGERFQPDCRRPRRSLKNLLQEALLPPWERERLPLLYCGGELVWAHGLGIACGFQASPRESALRLRWRSDGL